MAKTKTSPALSTDALKPYVQRAMTDPELREDLLAAFVAAREIYGQMAKGRGLKGKAETVSEKDFQKQLQSLVGDLTEASDKLKGKQKKKGHKTRNRIVLLTGVTLGVLYNPWTGQATRDWIMEQIAGGDGAGFEELGAELAAEAEEEAAAVGGNGSEP
jgi:ribonucleotide reductase alpha subunit